MITDLERFAFNQARFVMMTAYTIERDRIRTGKHESLLFEKIKKTDMGIRYLSNVSFNEISEEMKKPGSFMDKNLSFGTFLNNEYGSYIEDFVEK